MRGGRGNGSFPVAEESEPRGSETEANDSECRLLLAHEGVKKKRDHGRAF